VSAWGPVALTRCYSYSKREEPRAGPFERKRGSSGGKMAATAAYVGVAWPSLAGTVIVFA
jgi:hypothetical protein